MKFDSEMLLGPDTSVKAEKTRLPDHTCSSSSSCLLPKACIPHNFTERETLQFESLVSGKRRIARHASLYRKHDTLGMLYVVRFGQFKLIGEDLTGQQRVAGYYMAGDLMGLDAIATGKHHFRLIALENSEVCEIPFAPAVSMMSVEPAFQRHFLQTMSESLNNEFSRSFLAATSLDERFASFLLSLGEKYARLGYSDKSFRLPMSRSDIGSYLGTTVESISRLIARFNAHGAVSISGRMVELCDRPRLKALMCGDPEAVKRGIARVSNRCEGDLVANEPHVSMAPLRFAAYGSRSASSRLGGKQKTLALGVYPAILLAQARRRRHEAHKTWPKALISPVRFRIA